MPRSRVGKTVLLAITGAYNTSGGIAAANRLAIDAFVDAGYEVELLALNEPTSDAPLLHVRQRGFSGRKAAFARAVWGAMLSRRHAFAFFDHVNLAAVMFPVIWIPHAPVITRLNGIEVFPPNPSLEGRLGLLATDHLTAISEFTRKQVLTAYPKKQITTVDLALSKSDSMLSDAFPPTPQISLESVEGTTQELGSRVILHVGRMAAAERYKGQDVLIKTMELIIVEHPDAQLVLVGTGDDYDRIRALIQAQPASVRQRVFMPGYIGNDLLRSLYQTCYLVAMPSRGEGFGLVYLEAMRWKKPCIGSLTDAASTIIENGVTGLLVNDPTDSTELAGAIASMFSSPARVTDMGVAAFARLKSHYLFEDFCTRFIDYIDHCLPQSSDGAISS